MHLGSDKAGIDWKIPFPDIADIDISFHKGGIELMKEQFNYYILEPIGYLSSEIQETVTRIGNEDFLLSIVGISVIAIIFSGIIYLGEKLWKRYR